MSRTKSVLFHLTSIKLIQMYRLDNNELSKPEAASALAEAVEQMSSLQQLMWVQY